MSDFTFQGNPYELQVQGGQFDIVAVVGGNPTFNPLVNGHVNIGLTNEQPFTPAVTSAVPEPANWVMLVLGFLGLGLFARRSRKLAAMAA